MKRDESRILRAKGHAIFWHLALILMLASAVLAFRLTAALSDGRRDPAAFAGLVASLALFLGLFAVWSRYLFSVIDLKRWLVETGGEDLGRRREWRAARIDKLWLFVRFDNPLMDHVPVYLYKLDRALARVLPFLDRRKPEKDGPEAGSARPDSLEQGEASIFQLGRFAGLEGVCLTIDRNLREDTATADLDPDLARALRRAAENRSEEGAVLKVEFTDSWLRVSVRGGTWLGDRFRRRIDDALGFTQRLIDGLSSRWAARDPERWSVEPESGGFALRPIDSGKEEARRPKRPIQRRLAMLPLALLPWIPAAAGAQTLDAGVGFLTDSQQVDGSWTSDEVRLEHATTEALRALGALDRGPTFRAAAADFLESAPVRDNDDRSRRLAALTAEGRDVTALASGLAAAADPDGGWGLTAGFVADPLDTALAVGPLQSQPGIDAVALQRALSTLLFAQKDDGGWPCVDSGDGDADSEIFCTSHAILALVAYRSQFFLDPEIGDGAAFLQGQLKPDGSFGPAGPNSVIHTALSSLALASIPAFGGEVATVIGFLEGQQLGDGSWNGDAYSTALALRALQALAAVPFCGDGTINQPGEACDGADLGGLTCDTAGQGAGILACSPACTLDTSGCADPPICGDDLRNQPFEVCDGVDLAAQSCVSLGFASGNLACDGDCTSFDVSACNAEASCGDGVVNLPGELCDLNDLNGQTCESLGLGGGLLQCASDCNLDTSLCDAAGFEIDNKGREFFIGFLPNFDLVATAALHLTSDVATSVTVQYPAVAPSFQQTVAVNPGQVTIVPLPRTAYSGWPAGQVRTNSVRASAPDEFVVYMVNRRIFSSDAGMALPVDALGTSYIASTNQGSFIVSQDRSQFVVVAPFDSTTVTITPTTTMRLFGSTTPPGVPVEITLNRGQGFRGEAAFFRTDLTGTLIESDRAVAVTNGNICANVPVTTPFCDHIFEVAHPVRSWGNSALVTNLPNRPAGSFYRVVAAEDGTEVTLDGVVQAMLPRGGLLEVGPLAGRHVFAANHPIFVTQLMTGDRFTGATLGDPAVSNMIPPEQYLEKYTFSTVGGGQFAQHFLTVTAPDATIGSVLLDGAPIAAGDFTPIAGTGFSSSVLPIAEGPHTTSSPEPHGITVEGFNSFDSYIYPGGARLEFINQFCGDGEVNQDGEECDGSDFGGATCASFGFSAGFLQCSAECQIDTSQCTGVGNEDNDEDGFPVTEDCDDLDPEVNPGMPEIPGNGIDDDCNPATPDEIPEGTVICGLAADRISYVATDTIGLEASVENLDDFSSLTGLNAVLAVTDSGGSEIFSDTRQLAPLPPGARAQLNFALSALGNAADDYGAVLTVTAGLEPAALCSTDFAIESSGGSGAGLVGTLTLDPELVNAGDPSDAEYTVENQGNAALIDLALRVLLLDPETGEIVGELVDSTDLGVGGGFTASQPFSTLGLQTNKSFLAVLLATPSGSAIELTLDSATLTVVNAPPDCSGAFADPGGLWPPNHRMVEVGIDGVTDPDGDPVTLTILGVLQDESPNGLGDGDTCPDAEGVGTSQASVRRERSGQQDGRVYHLLFLADDGRGGLCEGEVTVCVPHDQGAGSTCVDQGALFDSTACP